MPSPRVPTHPASPGAGGIEGQLCPGEDRWHSADFQADDVLIFPSYTAHKALPSKTHDRVRLSFDGRYQPADLPIDLSSLKSHRNLIW